MKDKKTEQLGMNPSTASHRLVKDILWALILQTGQGKCCKCGHQMTRETFSIEHKIPWLDSDNPKELYFDLNNISFSHLSCNVADSRKPASKCGTINKYDKHGCRCEACKNVKREVQARYYTPERRKSIYARTGH